MGFLRSKRIFWARFKGGFWEKWGAFSDENAPFFMIFWRVGSAFLQISARNAARTVAFAELFDLGNGDAVEIALDRMLQGRGGHGKLDGGLAVLALEQGIDQAGA